MTTAAIRGSTGVGAATAGLTSAQLVYGTTGGGLHVTTGYHIGTFHLLINPAAVDAGVLLESDLELPADARIETALFELIADPVVTSAKVSSVADVRPSTPTSGFTAAATVDFGRLITVGGIVAPGQNDVVLGIGQVLRWTGSQWAFVAAGPAFAEIAAERLLVQSTDSADTNQTLVDRLVARAGVVLPVVPSLLELLVDGRTVWFERQGSSPVQVEDPVPASASGVRYVVDRTDAVREAFARAAASAGTVAGGGSRTVRVALRVGSPGRLALRPQLRSLRVHTQSFPPEGLSRTLDLPEEGIVELEVTPPAAQTVHEVALVVRGQFGPERVHPPVGPPINPAARLVLAAGRSVLIGLPRTLVSRFGTVSGVRLHLRAADGARAGGQVTGRLLAATATDRPGDPVDGGELTAVTVSDPVLHWYTLPFAEPVAIAPPADGDIVAWLELQPGYGEVECALTGADPADPLAPGGPLRRRRSGGSTGALTTIPALGPLHAALRVAGLPDRDRPLAAVTLQVAGTPDTIGVNPTADDLTATLTLQAPVDGAAPVLLRVTCAAPGSLVLDTVRVTYREE